jgi:hypothetical protein
MAFSSCTGCGALFLGDSGHSAFQACPRCSGLLAELNYQEGLARVRRLVVGPSAEPERLANVPERDPYVW